MKRALRLGAGAVAVAVIGAGATLSLLPAREAAGAATVMLPPAKAAALVQATSGNAALDMRAVGDQAKLINAALPFAQSPLHAARPFAASGSDTDQRRALLCLTQAVYYEAGFEPVDGRRAVAQVVLNRMRHPAFPKSVCGVVYQGIAKRRLPVYLRLRRRALSSARRGCVGPGPGHRPRCPGRLRRPVGG